MKLPNCLTENKDFIRGVDESKYCSFNLPTEKIIWVKRFFLNDEWKNNYRYNSSFCKLEDVKNGSSFIGVMAGFCMTLREFESINSRPGSPVSEMNLEEQRIVDNYRRANNIHPTPFYEQQ